MLQFEQLETGRHVDLRQNALSMRNGLAISRAKFQSKCKCSVHTVCVRSAHASETQFPCERVFINYTSSTLEAIEII